MGKTLVLIGLGIAGLGLLIMLGVPLGPAARRLSRPARELLASTFPLDHVDHLSILLTLAARVLQTVTMSIKSDTWITRMALEHQMIEPFVDDQVRAGVISYGVSSYGYDVRVGDEFKVFTNVYNTSSIRRTSIRSRSSTSRPTSASSRRTRSRWRSTIEYFRIPRDILTVCLGKSTYARCGIIVNVTPFEPEWEGHVDDRDLEHDAAAGEDLRQRGDRPGALLPERRAVRGVVQGQEGQVSGAARRDAAAI